MSVPPPSSSSPPPSAPREHVVLLEPARGGWGRRRGGEDALRLSHNGAVVEHTRALQAPLRLPLGQLQLGLVDPGLAHASGMTGRFPVLKRLSATVVIPREQGIEGWLWTSRSGSALTVLGDPDEAPNAALLLTAPLGEEAIAAAFAPEAAAEIAARSALGAPTVHGLLFRVADQLHAERVFGEFGLLGPLTDREVAPTLRRSLPTDRRARPTIRARGADPRAVTSVAPPGMG